MKPTLYRRDSRWPLALAFVSAAAIHVSGLAFSPTPAPDAGADFDPPVVALDPGPSEPEPRPETQDDPVVSMPPPALLDDTPQERQPTPRVWKKAGPIRVYTPPVLAKSSSGSGKAFAVSAPRPAYPYEARVHHITGSGIVRLEVDPASGQVLNAAVTQSTGSPLLDQSAVGAFRRWKFKTGTPATVQIPVTFTMFGAQL
jgi:periplasmic protein TonB